MDTSPGDAPALRVVLASGSPRRAGLLRGLGLEFDVEVPMVDESVLPGEDPVTYVARVAASKAEVGWRRRLGSVVIAADTTVALGAEILSTPVDAADALRMLEVLAGRCHEVHTAVVVRSPAGAWDQVVTSTVTMADHGPVWREWYVSTGEPLDKAGAYGVQGFGAVLVVQVDGSMTNVIGLPVVETAALLTAAGIKVPAHP